MSKLNQREIEKYSKDDNFIPKKEKFKKKKKDNSVKITKDKNGKTEIRNNNGDIIGKQG